MTTFILVQPCPLCDQESKVEVDQERYIRWREGQALREPVAISGIQVIFPDLSADDRETIMSGTHPACWERVFGGDEDDQ